MGKGVIETELLRVAQFEMQDTYARSKFLQALLPFLSPGFETMVEVVVRLSAAELVDPSGGGGHGVENLPAEKSVFRRGNQRFHLCRRTGK